MKKICFLVIHFCSFIQASDANLSFNVLKKEPNQTQKVLLGKSPLLRRKSSSNSTSNFTESNTVNIEKGNIQELRKESK